MSLDREPRKSLFNFGQEVRVPGQSWEDLLGHPIPEFPVTSEDLLSRENLAKLYERFRRLQENSLKKFIDKYSGESK